MIADLREQVICSGKSLYLLSLTVINSA
ncbi:uncharacterized protein METZ01_LOCUS26852 [marine metagenome]|uniref:Uncharacterized protein n=1 Tax=marine metagenome TaxID=408172 RepID=A0A381Q4Y6_9ZZZZ